MSKSKKLPVKFEMQLEEAKYGTPAISKPGAEAQAQKIYNDMLEGHSSPIQIAEMFNFVGAVEKELKELSDDKGLNNFASLVRDEIVKNSNDGKSHTSKWGTKVELFEAGTKWFFDKCGDEEWDNLNKELTEIKEKMKTREAFLKTIKGSLKIVNEETGEVKEIFPAYKTSTSTFKSTLLKN